MGQLLTARQIDALEKPGTYRAAPGLYVQLRPNGARSWVLRYQRNGIVRVMGLGPLRLVNLSEAKAKAIQEQKRILDGLDPVLERRATRQVAAPTIAVPTFAECAEQYIAAHESAWRSPKSAGQWRGSLQAHAFAHIGQLPVDQVTVDHLVALLQPIWTTKSETAGRIRSRVERILDWARAKGLRTGDNPAVWAGSLSHLLPPLGRVQKVEHFAALPHKEVAAIVAQIRAKTGASARALEFTILTAARSGEARGATWEEIDLAAKLWVVPADRIKSGREHRVPLSDAAVKLLQGMPGRKGVIFRGPQSGTALSDMSLLKVMRDLRGQGATVHGFRSSFRDWAAECTDFPREVAEAALAHVVGDKTEAAYRRSDLFERRRALMAAWAEYVTA